MGPHCKLCLLSVTLFITVLPLLSYGTVFRRAPHANAVFLRPKRANSFFIEEMLQGNLERECFEERCSFEEAREYFEDEPKTNDFWAKYYDGDQCLSNPCLHEGGCTDLAGGFLCNCTVPYYGHRCELSAVEVDVSRPPTAPQVLSPELGCPTEGPQACEHFCSVTAEKRCSCAKGYKLNKDDRTCSPEGRHPCGKVSLPKAEVLNVTTTAGLICPDGRCPWQVSVVDVRGETRCEGVVLGRRSVLTAAECLYSDQGAEPRPSNFLINTGDPNKAVTVPIRDLHMHSRYQRGHHDDNLVLVQLARALPFGPALYHICLPTKDFSENVLMRPGRPGLIGQSPRKHVNNVRQSLAYMSLPDCRKHLNASHPLSNKMFCMRSWSHARGHSGLMPQHGRESRNEDESQNGRQTQRETGGPRGQGRKPIQNGGRNLTENDRGFKSGKGNRESMDAHYVLVPGTPMATEERGTVFVTGLLLSHSNDGGGGGSGGHGVFFTKLSRYLFWIQQKLDLAENAEMTQQMSNYPSER